MNERQYQQRIREFEGPISEVALNNSQVHRIIKLYATGQFVTREEALSQMVIALAQDWAENQRRVDLQFRSGLPLQ